MQFLSDLSTLQRAGGAAVLVLLLVLLLVKQRQAKGAPAAKASAPKAERPSRMSRAPRDKAGKSKAFSRGKKGKEGTDAPVPTAEPKSTSGRMVPRLPAAEVGGDATDVGGTAQLDTLAEPMDGAPATEATEATDGMISEPGWPTPGEVWASPDSVNGYGAAEESWEGSTNGAGEHDDPLAALTETPETDAAGWDTDNLEEGFDPASGWSETDEAEEASDDDVPAWEKEQAEFDWTATDADSEWGAPDADEATDEISSAQAAWEAPEDDTATWSAEDLWEMPKEEPAEEVASVATAVAEEPFAVAEWTMPETTVEPVSADEPAATLEVGAVGETAEAEHTPAIVWDPVDEVEEIEPDAGTAAEPQESSIALAVAEPIESPDLAEVAAESQAPVFELPVIDPVAHHEPVAEALPEVVAEEVAEPVVDEIAEPVVEDFTEPVAEPVVEDFTEPVAEPVVEDFTEPVAEPVVEDFAEPVAEPVVEDFTEPVAEPVVEDFTEPVAEPVVEDFTEPVAEETPEPAAEIVIETEPVLFGEPEAEVLPSVAELEPVVDVVEELSVAEMDEIVDEPLAEEPPSIAAEIVDEPMVESFRPAVVVEHFHPFDVPSFDDEEDAAETHMFEVDDEPVPVGSSPSDPVSRWASMMPGGSQEPTVDPVSSWSRLQPGATPAPAASVSAPPAPAATPQAMPAAMSGVAWWDVPAAGESDPRRGRFALGGYALQAGHQVVSGVTFRDGVVPPPSHWVIGPVLGAVAPGTLVLEVDGCLNCVPGDVEVLMDHGFAPTPEGFSLRLTAAGTGPFAASGTFVIS